MTEQLEKKQWADRECRVKHKHAEQLSVISSHRRDVLAVNCIVQDRVLKLGRVVLQFCVHMERKEQKWIEQLVKALKVDDEEMYM